MLPHNNIAAVLFDMDGTLIDTDDTAVHDLTRRLRPLLGTEKAPLAARRLLMAAEWPGNTLLTLMDALHLDETLFAFTDRLRQRRGLHPAGNFQLIPGVAKTVQQLHGHYQLGIVTTRGRAQIDQFLTSFPELADLFVVSCARQDTRRLKPHPAPIQLAARRLQLPAERCLMVGDTTVDIKSARRAGAWAVGVLCGFGERAELEKAGAHLVLDSTADLAQVLLGQ